MTDPILNSFQTVLHTLDLQSVENSTSLYYIKNFFFEPVPTTSKYLLSSTALHCKRVMAQCRLMSKYCPRIYINFVKYKLDENICNNCDLLENENLDHILISCPLYTDNRKTYFESASAEHISDEIKDFC